MDKIKSNSSIDSSFFKQELSYDKEILYDKEKCLNICVQNGKLCIKPDNLSKNIPKASLRKIASVFNKEIKSINGDFKVSEFQNCKVEEISILNKNIEHINERIKEHNEHIDNNVLLLVANTIIKIFSLCFYSLKYNVIEKAEISVSNLADNTSNHAKMDSDNDKTVSYNNGEKNLQLEALSSKNKKTLGSSFKENYANEIAVKVVRNKRKKKLPRIDRKLTSIAEKSINGEFKPIREKTKKKDGKLTRRDEKPIKEKLEKTSEKCIGNAKNIYTEKSKSDLKKMLKKTLAEISNALGNKIPISEEGILKSFPNLKNLVFDLFGKETKKLQEFLNVLLNRAIINNALKSKVMISEKRFNGSWITSLGYDGEKYLDNEANYEVIKDKLKKFSDKYIKNINFKDFKKKIHFFIHMEKLVNAGVDRKDLNKVNMILSEANEYYLKLKEFAMAYKIKLPNQDQFPQQVALLQDEVFSNYMVAVELIMGNYIKQCKNLLNQNILDIKTQLPWIAKNLLQKDELHLRNAIGDMEKKEEIYKVVTWLKKYGRYILKELIQGFLDDSEALEEGCCYAICMRLSSLIQQKPDIDRNALISNISILPADRFNQVSYAKNSIKNIDANSSTKDLFLPEKLKKKYLPKNHHQEILFISTCDQLKYAFADKIGSLASSNGVLELSINFEQSAHSTFIQCDESHKSYRIFDPNIGLVEIPIGNRNHEEMVSYVLEIYSSMIDALYGVQDIRYICASNVVANTRKRSNNWPEFIEEIPLYYPKG